MDREDWREWGRKAGHMAGVLATLVIAGTVLGTVGRPAWERVRSSQPELRLKDLEGAVGQGTVLGLLGGLRGVIADFAFLRAYVASEKRDLPATEANIRLATTLDPSSTFFWINGARILAFDIPAWRIKALRKAQPEGISPALEDHVRREQALRGLEFLDEGLRHRPGDPRLLLEQAYIHILRLNNRRAAAPLLKRAASTPGAPYALGRLYADNLVQLGRPLDAYAYLRNLYPTLPNDRPDAARPIVLEWLRELEDTLRLPEAQRLPLQPEESLETANPQEGTP